DVAGQYAEAGNQVADRHGRHQSGGGQGNTLDATEDHQANENRHDQAGGLGIDAEGGMQAIGHGMRLHAIADAETGEHAEEGKQYRQPDELFAHALADVVHRAADPLAAAVLFTEMHGQYRFAIFGRHADQGDQPHPYQCTGATEVNGGGNAGNIAGADCGGQGRGQGGITGNGAFLVAVVLAELAETVDQLAQRHETQADGQVDAGAGNQYQHGHTPDNVGYLSDQGAQ